MNLDNYVDKSLRIIYLIALFVNVEIKLINTANRYNCVCI